SRSLLAQLDERAAEAASSRGGMDHADGERELGQRRLLPAEGDELTVLFEEPGVRGEIDAREPAQEVFDLDPRRVPGRLLLVEHLPMAVRRLVRADLGGDDHMVERHADPLERRVDVVAVGVREDRELPASRARVLERGAYVGKRLPGRQRARERVVFLAGK